jgi:hypothetical protein
MFFLLSSLLQLEHQQLNKTDGKYHEMTTENRSAQKQVIHTQWWCVVSVATQERENEKYAEGKRTR